MPRFYGPTFTLLATIAVGCGPSAYERTVSAVNVAADSWQGQPDFVVSSRDAYGRPLSSHIEKTTLDYVLEIRSSGPDGLPKNHDDIVVTRRQRHGESSLTKEAARTAGELSKSAAAGLVKGVKEGLGIGKESAAEK